MNFKAPKPEMPRPVILQRIRALATALENLPQGSTLKPDPVIHELLKLVKGVVETLPRKDQIGMPKRCKCGGTYHLVWKTPHALAGAVRPVPHEAYTTQAQTKGEVVNTRNLKRPKQTEAQKENPEYKGISTLYRRLRRQYPNISEAQATSMAACKIRPDLNNDAKFIGWDTLGRPCFSNTNGRMAIMRSGNTTTPAGDPVKYQGD